MDADLPTSDRVDAEPSEVDAEVSTPDGAVIGGAMADSADGRLDLDAIEADLAGVEVALARLGDGTYWTDEVTGEPLPDGIIESSPTARRA